MKPVSHLPSRRMLKRFTTVGISISRVLVALKRYKYVGAVLTITIFLHEPISHLYSELLSWLTI